jgi:O-antigen/teichoic acid export membrane protein
VSARPPRSARELLRDLAALVLGEGVAKLAGFAAFAYLARALPAERYGAVELASAITMLFFLAIDFGFAPIGARELARDRGQLRWLAAAIPTLRLALALASVACIALVSLALDQPEETRAFVRVYGLSLVAAPWVLNWLFQGLGRMLVVAVAQALRMLGFAALVFWLVRGDASLGAVAVAEIGSVVLLALYYTAMQARETGAAPRLATDLAALARLLRQAAPVGASRILWAVSQYGGTLIVASFAPAAELAWYGAAHRLAISLGAFVQLHHFNLFPALVEAVATSPERVRALLAPQLRASAWLAVLGGMLGVAFGAPICALLYGAPFARSGEPLAWLGWSLAAALVGSHARFLLLAAGRQRLELAANAAGAAVALLGGLALVPAAGTRGAAAAIVAGALATWAAAHALARGAGLALPGAEPLVRPALTCAAVALAARWLPFEGELARGVASVAALALAAPLVDPALRRDAQRLLFPRGAAR